MFPRTATSEKIISFKALPDGWHYGHGGPVTPQVAREATEIYHSFLLNGFSRTDAFAGAGGEVLVTAYYVTSKGQDHYIAAIVNPPGDYTLRHELNDEDLESDYLETKNLIEIKARIRRIAREIWNTSGLSIQETSTSIKAGSMTWRLKTLPMAQGCRSSNYHVLSRGLHNPVAA